MLFDQQSWKEIISRGDHFRVIHSVYQRGVIGSTDWHSREVIDPADCRENREVTRLPYTFFILSYLL